jgi:hypothetical protein
MYPTCRTKAGAIVMMILLHVAAYGQLSVQKAHSLFVYNFTKHIQWPDGAVKEEFVIAVYGKSTIREELEKLSTLKKVGDKVIKIIEITSNDQLDHVNILFIPEEKSGQLPAILDLIKGKPVLVVTERRDLIQKGAGISFFSDANNIKFELNNNSISNQKLKVSKQLAALSANGSGI